MLAVSDVPEPGALRPPGRVWQREPPDVPAREGPDAGLIPAPASRLPSVLPPGRVGHRALSGESLRGAEASLFLALPYCHLLV